MPRPRIASPPPALAREWDHGAGVHTWELPPGCSVVVVVAGRAVASRDYAGPALAIADGIAHQRGEAMRARAEAAALARLNRAPAAGAARGAGADLDGDGMADPEARTVEAIPAVQEDEP